MYASLLRAFLHALTPPSSRPPLANSFLEDGYFRADPFAERRRPLFIGADCTLCRRPVCAQPTCSLFYTRRFCASCAKRNEVRIHVDVTFSPATADALPWFTEQEAFPDEMKRDLGKLQAMSPPPGYFDT